jgi:hypothetical protein
MPTLTGLFMLSPKWEAAMPLTAAIFLAAVCIAFIRFGLVLAWGDYQTSDLKRKVPPF